MLKAIKECLRNWLVTHERLYWYIVVGLAVLGFGIVTAMGMAKLEKANAAVEFSVNAPEINYDTLPTYQQVVDAVVEGFGVAPSEVTAENTVLFAYDGNNYHIFYGDDIDKLECYGLSNGCNINAKSSVTRISINGNTGAVASSTFNGGFMGIYETRNEYQGYVWGAPIYCWERNGTMPILTPVTDYPKGAEYSPDAPFVSFKSLIIDNLLTKGTDDKNVAGLLYTDYFVPSYWQIFYDLENISELDISYKLNLQFEVEIPTLSYVQDLYEDFGYDFSSERSILKRSKELVEYWNKHKNADSRTVTVDYSLDIVPNTYGNFNYQFSFLEWEYMLRAFSSELNTEFDSYTPKERAALLAFMHVKKITSEVVTTRADSVVYGGYTTNVFERGIYDSCVDVYTRVDKDFVSSDVLDDLISSDLDAAEDAYKEELENRLDEMQNQIDSMQNFDVAFGGDLESTNVWTSFTSLVKGLASFAPAIAALSSLAGVVLGFLPLQVGGVIASTLLAICVIALIKAIRG